ncbi:MAG TPA: hypothetical protein VFK31_00545 [Rhodanobacteraceae bacterium]|nr:hypothetical protein [Rhodanobacteraceae bacterium]
MSARKETWPEDMPISLDHSLVPPAIAAAVREMFQPGDVLHRVSTDKGVEWWLFDAEGELVETFWLE